MPGISQTLQNPPPVSVQHLINAVRVALVNLNHPGTITYDPLTTPPPQVSNNTLIYGVLLAAQGEQQS